MAIVLHNKKEAKGIVKKRRARRRPSSKNKTPTWDLRLYICDTTARSSLAKGNLLDICEEFLRGKYRLTIIDLIRNPELAREDQILAIPTLVRVFPAPQKAIIGSLSDAECVCRALGLGNRTNEVPALLQCAGSTLGHA
jgi:circadian clock protein KaiB